MEERFVDFSRIPFMTPDMYVKKIGMGKNVLLEVEGVFFTC
jgi:hypothetical protein